MNNIMVLSLSLTFILVLPGITYSQTGDDSLSSASMLYKEGRGSDSTLLLLYQSHRISKAALDSARFVRLRAELKYKFPLDFIRTANINKSVLNGDELTAFENFSSSFRKRKNKPKGALESFNYLATYVLYSIASFYKNDTFYVLTGSGAFGMMKMFLLDSAQEGYQLLDTFNFDPNANPKIDVIGIDGHEVIRLREKSYGTDYMDEKEVLIGVIHDRFENLFATDLLQANNWEIKSGRGNDFDRWIAEISFINSAGKGQMAIKKEVSEDLISMKGVKDFDFADGRVIKHIRSWTEIYVWDNNAQTFVLNRNLSTGGNGGN